MLMNLCTSKHKGRKEIYASVSLLRTEIQQLLARMLLLRYFSLRLLKGRLLKSTYAFSIGGHELKYRERIFFHVANADPSRSTVKNTAFSFFQHSSGTGKPFRDILTCQGS